MSLRSEVVRIFNELIGNGKKISQLPAGSAPTGTELIEAVQGGVSVSLTVNQVSTGGSGVLSVVAGANVSVDNTDPQNPIVSATGGGGGTTEHVTKNANFIVDIADTRKTYVIDSASPVTAQLPDLSAAVVDYEWGLIYVGAGGGDIDVNGQPAVSSNGVDFDFVGPDVQMYLYYDSEAGEYRFQNGTAGAATGDLQNVLDAGSSATITSDVEITRTGEYSLELKAATGITLSTTNEPIAINAGVTAGGSRFDLYVDAVLRLQISGHNDHYTTGGVSYHRFFNGASAGHIRLMEASGNGSNYIALKAPEDVTTAQIYTFPAAGPGTNGDVLASTTGGQLSWITPSGGSDDLDFAVMMSYRNGFNY